MQPGSEQLSNTQPNIAQSRNARACNADPRAQAAIAAALSRPPERSTQRDAQLLDLAAEAQIGGSALGLLEQVNLAQLNAKDRVRFLRAVQAQAAWFEAFSSIALAAVCGPTTGWPEDEVDALIEDELAESRIAGAAPGERLRVETEARSQAWETRERAIALEVSLATRVSTRTAGRRVESSRFLAEEIPEALGAAWAGHWAYGHLRVAEKELAEVPRDVRSAVLDDVLPHASTDHPRRLTDRLRKSIAHRDAHGVTERTREKSAQRDVGMWTLSDGQSRLAITGPHALICTIHRDVLDVARVRKAVVDSSPEVFAEEDRRAGAVRVDAVREAMARLSALARGAEPVHSDVGIHAGNLAGTVHSDLGIHAGNLAGTVHSDPWLAPNGTIPDASAPGSRPRADAAVVIDLATALGMSDEPGFVPGYGWVPASLGREILADAPRWRRWLLDDRSRRLIEVGTTRYRPSQALRDLVTARDLTCTADTCNRPATQAQLDHAIDFDGANTTPANVHATCGPDHLAVTAGYFIISEDDQGRVTWTSTRSGTTYPSHLHPLYDLPVTKSA